MCNINNCNLGAYVYNRSCRPYFSYCPSLGGVCDALCMVTMVRRYAAEH